MDRLIDEQLEKLKTRIIKMCSLVDEQVNMAIRAVSEENIEMAQTVILRDSKVDKYDVKIDKICQKIFALNQPVAMDLRLIMSALTINSNLERMGDIAVNLAEEYMRIGRKPDFFDRVLFNDMAAVVKEMIKNSIDSFIENNARLAQKVITMDDQLDQLNRDNQKVIMDIMEQSPANVQPGVALINISREMERLGDHATNIAEDVYFIVEAQLIKHKYEKYLFNESEKDEDEEGL